MIRLITPLIILLQILISAPARSQKPASVENINLQPLWGPTGYKFVEYYYIPACEIYYHVPTAQFIYRSGNDWLYSKTVPFSTCDIYSSYKVVINEARPYYRHYKYFKIYKDFATSAEPQETISESADPKYFVVNGHPQFKNEKEKKIPAKKDR